MKVIETKGIVLKAMDYKESGTDEQVLKIIGKLHNSRQRSVASSLLFAKLLYQCDRLDEASKVLDKLKVPASSTKFPMVILGSENKGQQISEVWSDLYHAIRYLIAVRQERFEDAMQEAKPLLREDKILEKFEYESN